MRSEVRAFAMGENPPISPRSRVGIRRCIPAWPSEPVDPPCGTGSDGWRGYEIDLERLLPERALMAVLSRVLSPTDREAVTLQS